MSGKGNGSKSQTVSKKKQKNKRQASSPLYDNGQLHVHTDKNNGVNTSERKSGQKKKNVNYFQTSK